MGSIFRQKGKGRSKNWMIQYFAGGKRKIESAGTPDKLKARELLKLREGAIASGEPIELVAGGRRGAYRFEDGARAYDTNLANAGRRSRSRMVRSVEMHLTPVFGGRRLDEITTTEIEEYTRARLEAGAEPATVKHELAALKRIFVLAQLAGKITRRPHIPMPRLNNARKGFFERDQFEAVRRALPEYLRGPVTFAYLTGWRLASEVCKLEWRHIDLKAGIIKLDPGETKNDEGRTFPFRLLPELAACIEAADRQRQACAQEGRIIPRVFHHDGVSLIDPKVGDLESFARTAWKNACKAAGVPGRIPHDFRRTAVRNLERAGVPRSSAMALVGHKTEAIYRRYAIVDEAALNEGVALLARAAGGGSRRGRR
jgi:integrase